MGSLSKWEREKALRATFFLCMRQLQGLEPEEQVAQELGFGSVETMRLQLGNWGAPDWITKDDEKVSDKPRVQKPAPPERKARGASQPEEVPAPSAAAGLFKDAIDGLARAIENLEDLPLIYQAGRFGSASTSKRNWYYPRRAFTEQEWQALCERYGHDPDAKGLSLYNEPTWRSLGASPFPPRDVVALIAAYALSDRPIEPLVEVLHPKHSQSDLDEIKTFLNDTKSPNSSDGLRRRAQQFAAMVYGHKVARGAPPEEPPYEYWLACHITERREAGISNEAIHQDLLDSGHELSKEEFKRLANLWRRFPET
jgi:hypothetical protein